MTPEGRIKAKVNHVIQSVLATYPGKIWRFMPVQRGMGRPALDYILCVNGRFVSVETKRDEKHGLTAQQLITKADIVDAGGYVFVVNGPGTCTALAQSLSQLIENPEHFDAFYRGLPP